VSPQTDLVTRSRAYQVKDVARLTGVSIRTLHHYDAIGLLVPGGRTAGGYRLYTDADLLRLQQILIGRELGLRSKGVVARPTSTAARSRATG
jgi:MerR family transcriptional regulator, thiopeptide resistance regulator